MTRPGLRDCRVLITGGAGFIGSHLAEQLSAGSDVWVLDDLSVGSRSNIPEGTTFIEGDVRDPCALSRAMEGVDVVFHQAALVSIEDSITDPATSHEINVDATVSLLDLARTEDARFVFASSAAVYGHPETVPIPEDHPTNPISPYGVDKLVAEHYCRVYHELYGLETVRLRYFNVYGPRQHTNRYSGVIRTFIRQALAGEPITVHGDGTQTRDFVHVRDVVEANLLAATTDQTGGVFNIGSGERVAVGALAESIRSIVGSPSDIVHTDPRTGDIQRSHADIGKARDTLGYAPSIRLDDGVEDLVAWIRDTRGIG